MQTRSLVDAGKHLGWRGSLNFYCTGIAIRSWLLLLWLPWLLNFDSIINVLTGLRWTIRTYWSIPGAGQEGLSSQKRPDLLRGAPSLPLNTHWGALFPGGKLLGREADNWPPSSAKFKSEWSYTSAHLHAFTACTYLYLYLISIDVLVSCHLAS
jgi:hypothetical protein